MKVTVYRFLDKLYSAKVDKREKSYKFEERLYEFDFLKLVNFSEAAGYCISESKEEAIKIALEKAERELAFDSWKANSLKHKISKMTFEFIDITFKKQCE